MKKSTKTIVHDEELQIEACHFQGITQSFPNHFHEYHVIGCIEQGQRRLSCRNRDYTVGKGVILLFSPGDSHACTQKQGGALDYPQLSYSEQNHAPLYSKNYRNNILSPFFRKCIIR